MNKVPPNRSILLNELLPPAVWFHGSQSTTVGGDSTWKGITWQRACMLEHIMRCVLMTPLGVPVEPDVKRIFATVSGPTSAKALTARAVGTVSQRLLKAVAFDIASPAV